MASRDLRRLLDGAALVAREAARRASAPDVLRSALLAATDLAGLTRGTPRTPRPTPPLGPHHPAAAAAAGEARASVVYFSHDDAGPVSPPRRPPQDPPLEQRPPARESPHPAQAKEITEAGVAAAVGAAEPEPVAVARPPDGEAAGRSPAPSPSPSPVVRVEKRRRPRERRVPSTPFTRALGSVCHTMHRFEQGEMRIRLFVKLRIEQCVNRVVFFCKICAGKIKVRRSGCWPRMGNATGISSAGGVWETSGRRWQAFCYVPVLIRSECWAYRPGAVPDAGCSAQGGTDAEHPGRIPCASTGSISNLMLQDLTLVFCLSSNLVINHFTFCGYEPFMLMLAVIM